MATEINFTCDFCRKKIVDKSLNDDYVAYCKTDKGNWTSNLRHRLDGPHICKTCIRDAGRKAG